MKYTTKIPIYENNLTICSGDDVLFVVKKYKLPDDYKDYKASVYRYGGGKDLIMLFNDVSYSLIHHESIHAAWRTLDYVGIEPSAENQEVLTYLSEWIFDLCCKKLKGEIQ